MAHLLTAALLFVSTSAFASVGLSTEEAQNPYVLAVNLTATTDTAVTVNVTDAKNITALQLDLKKGVEQKIRLPVDVPDHVQADLIFRLAYDSSDTTRTIPVLGFLRCDPTPAMITAAKALDLDKAAILTSMTLAIKSAYDQQPNPKWLAVRQSLISTLVQSGGDNMMAVRKFGVFMRENKIDDPVLGKFDPALTLNQRKALYRLFVKTCGQVIAGELNRRASEAARAANDVTSSTIAVADPLWLK